MEQPYRGKFSERHGMKNFFVKLRYKAVPAILSIALILTGVMSFHSIKRLQGNARVINYIGIVRGATQRLVKKELSNEPDDELIEQLDGILEGLANGSKELELIRLSSDEFQKSLKEMTIEWNEIKEEIALYRKGASGDRLFSLSEAYFDLTNNAVYTVEKFTEARVDGAGFLLIIMNFVFICLAVISGLSAFFQEKRQKELQKAEEENRKRSRRLTERLQEILVPMNEISELMYISDPETYELLFINQAGKETFHLEDKLEGVKCYKALQGLEAPCPFCTIPFLKKDENYNWEYTNPLTKRHYLLKDRLVEWEGKTARMEIAFDITDTINEKIELEKKLERDNVLLECIRELYRNHDMQQASDNILKQTGELFLAERAYIFTVSGDYMVNTAEWCREGVEPQMDNLQKISLETYSLWVNMFKNRENIIIEDMESMRGTREYELMSGQGIQRVILVPLDNNGSLSGLIGLDNPDKALLKSGESFLLTLRYFMMLAARRNEDEEKLSCLSFHDTLTSFYNRNRYIQDVEALINEKQSAGVVFLDVNGLKEINDSQGHDAGDLVLKECADIMRGFFENGSFYRIGGDEFVIISTGMDEEGFYKVVGSLKEGFQGKKCQAAIGAQWCEACDDIRRTISLADEKMYRDKKEYYHSHKATGRYRHYTDFNDF